MRSIIFAVVGSFLAVGAAQAGTCRLDGAELKARSQATFSADVPRLDLVGRTLRVERVSSRWRAPKVAEITVLVRLEGETFLVQQVSDFSGAPVDTVASTPATEAAIKTVSWVRSSSAERSHFSGSFDGIASGPLTSLDLTAANCT